MEQCSSQSGNAALLRFAHSHLGAGLWLSVALAAARWGTFRLRSGLSGGKDWTGLGGLAGLDWTGWLDWDPVFHLLVF